MIMRCLVGLMFFLLLLASPAAGAVRDAASCSQMDILASVAVSVDGDTIRIPAGTCVWTSTITINKGITLQGAGVGQTTIVDSKPRGSGILLNVNVPAGQTVRITGIEWRGDGAQSPVSDGTIAIGGCSITTANYRIDHNRFTFLQNNPIRTYGSLYGLIDHNTGDGTGGTHLANLNNSAWPRDGANCTGMWGDGSWASALAPGSLKAHYLEDNTWNGYNEPSTSIVDSNFGARVVVRRNTIIGTAVGSHGTDSGQRNRGQRWLEVYDNTFTFPAGVATDFAVWIRGGSGVVYNNRITVDRTAGFNWMVKHANLRSSDPRQFPPWGFCDGTAVWDGNTGDPSGLGYPCLDQPGSGTSVDFQDTSVPPNIPAKNALEPIYVWGNFANDVPENCGNQSWSCGSDGVVVAGRDIIYGTPRPGYVPFTYPHPLAGGSEASPLLPTNVTVAPLSTSIGQTPSLEAAATPAAPTVRSADVSTSPLTSKSTGVQPAAATSPSMPSITTPLSSAAGVSPSTTDVRPTTAIFPAASVNPPQGVGVQPNPATAPRREATVSPTRTSTVQAATDAGTTEPIRPESPPLRVAVIPPSATATRPTEITPGPPAAAGTAPQIVLGSPAPRRNRVLPVTVMSEIQLNHVKVFIDDKLVLTLVTTATKLKFSQSLPNRKAVMVRIEVTDAGGNRAMERVAIPAANDAHSVAGDHGLSKASKPLARE